jgi:two-component system LytT family response regulator
VLSDELVEIATEAQTWLSDWTLNALEARLPDRFVRVSRQANLNLDNVALLEPTDSGGYLARTSGGALVQVSRQAARGLRRALGI